MSVAFGVLAPTSMVARLAVIPAIHASDKCRLAAVASLSAPHGPIGVEGPAKRHTSYEALLADPDVEAVYIPLPNSLHREWTERSAAAGKHVLCEKPLASHPEDATAMASACEAAGVILMEAYMTPFHPRSRCVLDLVRSGRLGELLFASSAFTGVLSRPDDHRWRPEMGGGALLDVGIYCLAPILAAGGVAAPEVASVRVGAAAARRAGLGVDASFSGWLDLGTGLSAAFQCSFEAPERQFFEVVGTEAAVSVDRAFTPSHSDTSVVLRSRDSSTEIVTTEGGDPYLGMVEHFADVVSNDALLERPPADSIALAGLVERLDTASRAVAVARAAATIA